LRIAQWTLAVTLLGVVSSANSTLAGSATPERRFVSGLLTGNFMLQQAVDPLNGGRDTDAFDRMVGRRIGFLIRFDNIENQVFTSDGEGGTRWTLRASMPQVSFDGDPSGYLTTVVAPMLQTPFQIDIHELADGTIVFEGFEIDAKPMAPQSFSFHASSSAEPPGDNPGPQDVGLDTDTVMFERYTRATGLTDRAMGTATILFIETTPVAVEARTFGAVKSMYRGRD